MGYLHINNLYKQQDILLFKECYAMEKIHGCVQGKTKINMFDGTKKEISKIVVGDYVMGMNNDGSIIPSKITQVFHNGIENMWYEVSGTRFAAGRGGNGHFVIKCTGEHKFYSPEKNDYVKVNDLNEGDNVYCLKSDKNLTYLQKQVLLGIMLGDGTFFKNSISGKIEWVHKEDCVEYMEYRKLTSSIFPTEKNEFSNELTIQIITKIKKHKSKQGFMKHDIETETNNYFANDILVHNSSAHVGWKFETKQVNFFTGENHPLFLTLFDKDFLIKKFEEVFPDQDAVIFGEHYAGKCQGMSHTYGKESKFIGFDVKVGYVWLNVPNAEDVCNQFNVEFVDYVKIEVTLDNLTIERDKPSVQAVRNGILEPKKREGIVLRPLIEMRINNGERVISKYKPDEERETKSKREVNPEQLKILSDAKEIAEEWVTNLRLEHVLQKFPEGISMEAMGDIIKAMIADVYREGRDEIVESKEVAKAIGKKTVQLFKAKLQNKLK